LIERGKKLGRRSNVKKGFERRGGVQIKLLIGQDMPCM
jgi:hypothetical protein